MGACGHVHLNWPQGKPRPFVAVGFVLRCADCAMRWLLTERGWQRISRSTEVPTGVSRGRPPDPNWDLSRDAF